MLGLEGTNTVLTGNEDIHGFDIVAGSGYEYHEAQLSETFNPAARSAPRPHESPQTRFATSRPWLASWRRGSQCSSLRPTGSSSERGGVQISRLQH